MKPTADVEAIRRIILHPQIWPHLQDDHSWTAEEWKPRPNLWLMPDDGMAAFEMQPLFATLWWVHAAVLPEARHKSVDYGQQVIEWMRANTPARRLLAIIKEGNFPALALVRRLGFRKHDVIPNCLLIDGQAKGLHVLSLEIRT